MGFRCSGASREGAVTDRDVMATAKTLEGRHGQHAEAVALFFSTHHAMVKELERAAAWQTVAVRIRQRQVARIDGAQQSGSRR